MQHAFGLDIPRTLAEVCDPRRLALIVYDMQVGLRQLANGTEITANVAKVLGAARAAGVRVCFTRHLSLPKELMGVFQWRMAMAWQRADRVEQVQPWFLRDSPGFQLVPEMAPQPSEAVFDKITMSAFEGTPLNIALRDCGVNAFAIVGVATEIGIEPSVRHGRIGLHLRSSSAMPVVRGTARPASGRSLRWNIWGCPVYRRRRVQRSTSSAADTRHCVKKSR